MFSTRRPTRIRTIVVAGGLLASLGLAGCATSYGNADSPQVLFAGSGVYIQVEAGYQVTWPDNAVAPQPVDSLPTGAVQTCSGWSGEETVFYDPSVVIGQVMAQALCDSIPQ